MDIRHPQPTELVEIINRISAAFAYKEGEGNVAKDFPQLYNPKNSNHLWAAFEGGKLAGHAGFYPGVMKVETLPIPVAGIGGVYTDSAFQNHGVASKLVKKCAEEAAKEGAALAFLWSDKHEFYGKLGFHLVGRQWTIQLDPKHASFLRVKGEKSGLKAADVRVAEGEVGPEFLQQSRTKIEAYPVGLARTAEEHKLYMQSGACRVLSAWVGPQLVAYFLIGKGKDLANYVHEWAGDEAALHHLAAQCLETFGHSISVISPQFMPDEVNWIYSLDELGVPLRAEYMALVKLLDFNKVKALLKDYLTKLGLNSGDLVIEKSGDNYQIEWRKKTRLHFDEVKFMRLLFGPDMPAQQELKAFLPVRLWYWGMDSV